MKLIIDIRELSLINLCKKTLSSSILLEIKPLDIGDIILIDDNDKELLIFERKTINDLIASIKDGRYKEQSLRLNNYNNIHNHNIIYILEGIVDKNQQTLFQSSLTSLFYYKGFSVLRTTSILETSILLSGIASKIKKEIDINKRLPFYSIILEENEKKDIISYSSVIKTKKKDNITPNNFLEILLCNIPSINTNTAQAICKEYSSLKLLISSLEEDKYCLAEIKLKNKKIGKKISEKIYYFLTY